MQKEVGSFIVDDCFWLTSRGWVLAGELLGQVAPGNQLVFLGGIALSIRSVEAIRVPDGEKIGLLITHGQSQDPSYLSEKQIIGLTAQILAQNA
jgi:hypothetical protein